MPDIFSAFYNSQPALSPAWLFLLLFFGTFVSEDAACLLAGASVASGRTSFGFAVASCLAGIFVGDLLLYGLGRITGTRILHLRLVRRLLSDRAVERSRNWLSRNAAATVFISRFVSGLRLPTYLLAGTLKVNFVRFAIYFFMAAAVWTPILVGTAAFSIESYSPGNAIIAMIASLIVIRFIIKYLSWRNRRLALGRVRRLANWEFWPLAVFYFPVVCYVLYLGMRYRSLTLFTAANPGIPAGGFVGESKDEIYNLLARSARATDHMLYHVRLPSSDSATKRFAAAAKFKVLNELEFPLVLKPDRGERGKGVAIIRDRKQLGEAIVAAGEDMILQEFCDGVEASIFYFRLPNFERGQIFSITEKKFPLVVGDGLSTLEELILKDARAVCMAKKYFDHCAAKLDLRPATGEVVKLIDIGTHSRGAIFEDGEWIKTSALERKIDEICREVKGFSFGRFDIRAESFEDLKAGKNFKIVELNGVTSESTNIYDPRYSLFDAYRILFRQWKIAFEIGNGNRSLGCRPLTLRQLLRLAVIRDTACITKASGDKLVNIISTDACA